MHRRSFLISASFVAFTFVVGVAAALGQSERQVVLSPVRSPPNHPLERVLQFARDEIAYLEQTVKDYTCRIVKRERVNGVLQAHQSIRATVRPAAFREDELVRPMAVLLEFQAPRQVAGRRVLFVDGAFDDMMLVRQRRGGITLRIKVDGGLAARESTMPITNIGFHNMLQQTIQQMEDDMRADPTGENTHVELFRDAKIDGRPCTAIRITHPRPHAELDFHQAHVFIDEQNRLPVRLDYSDWPDNSAEQPVLLGEFTYLDVKVNVGLSDADFDPGRQGFHVPK